MKNLSNLFVLRFLTITVFSLVVAACSSSNMTGSWTDSEFKGPIKKVYIVGASQNEMNRRIFEDAFSNQFFSNGVSSVASYRDITFSKAINHETIAQNMTEHGCDAVVLTRLIGQRKETVTTPARVSGYSPGPYYGGYGRYSRPVHYNSWRNYYGRPYSVLYEPATSTEQVILTVESVMYDLVSEQLIWSAQYETVVEGSIDTMIDQFVKEVTKDLKSKDLI